MKSYVGLLQRKDLLIFWNNLNGYQAGCSTVYSTLESCKSLSFGNRRLYILKPFYVSVASGTHTHTQSHSLHEWVTDECFVVAGFLRYAVSIPVHPFSVGRHSHLWSPTHTLHSLCIPAYLLCLSCSHSLPNIAHTQVPHRGRQQAGMPIASPCAPLRVADVIALLPGDSVKHINTYTPI